MGPNYQQPSSQDSNIDPSDLQGLSQFAMCQALEIEKLSLATVAGFNSWVTDVCKNSFWFAPMLGNLQEMVINAFVFCIQVQMNSLIMPAARIAKYIESSTCVDPIEMLERSMDIAVGLSLTFPDAVVVSISSNNASPEDGPPESQKEIAISAQSA
jgi:hypothetical protein